MQLFELFLDKFSETWIFEKAKSRANAKHTITELSATLMKHLVKLYIFDIPTAKQHWINEVNNYLSIINDISLKPKNRRLSSTDIYNWIVFEGAPNYNPEWIDSFVNYSLRTTYKDVHIHEHDNVQLLNHLLTIIKQISQDIEHDNLHSIEHYL